MAKHFFHDPPDSRKYPNSGPHPTIPRSFVQRIHPYRVSDLPLFREPPWSSLPETHPLPLVWGEAR